ncbi:copper chaperone PCu(A)C [Shewanella sp.]|uniref:copper chaperone PCu(A)C n=1 Tax=Shewanella sp. TaxID=50422 RepID=UPI00356B3BD1
MLMKKRYLAGLGALLLANLAQAGNLMVHDAWVRAMPPTARALPLYLTLHNGTAKPVSLTAITTSDGRVELHQSLHEGDKVKMQRLEHIEIAPNDMVSLAPMGLHGMILDMSRVPAEGETLHFVAHFDDGSQSQIDAQVVKAATDMASGHEHHH